MVRGVLHSASLFHQPTDRKKEQVSLPDRGSVDGTAGQLQL
jgi:hypothetical protein